MRQTVHLELKPITSIEDIPTGIAVHGTQLRAWSSIRMYILSRRFLKDRPTHLIIHVIPGTQGLSKMGRNHIHLAQGVAGKGVISGIFF